MSISDADRAGRRRCGASPSMRSGSSAALWANSSDVGPHQRAAVHVPERGGHLLVDHPHHLLGGHAVGGQRGHERAGAGADVDVELVDRAVHGQQVERAQGADLVDAAREAAAAQHQRGARAPRPAPRRLAGRPSGLPGRLLELDYLAHPAPSIADDRRTAPAPSLACSHPRCDALAAVTLLAALLLAGPGGRRGQAARCWRSRLDAPDARSPGGYVRRLCARRQRHGQAACFALARQHTRAHPGLEHEALHHRRPRWPGSAPTARSAPRCSATASSTSDGIWRGDLYLRGGGDPTFGSRTFTRAPTAAAPPCRTSPTALEDAGIERVTGRIYGDESRFDSLRGGPDSRLRRLDLGRPAQRALLQPRAGRPSAAPRSRPIRPLFAAAPAGRRARGARDPGAAASRPRGRTPVGARRRWPASTRRRWRASSG